MSRYLLALDAGTTAVKARVYDETGVACGGATRELNVVFPKPGWVEQDPRALARASREALAAAIAKAGVGSDEIAGLGISNQRSSMVAWDGETGEPLSPMIIWQDLRTADRCLELQSQGIFATPMMASTKAEWILKNVDAAAAAAKAGTLCLGTPNSWLAASLCGPVNVSDHCNASPTGLYSYFTLDWDPEVLKALGIEQEWLPELVDSWGELAVVPSDVFGSETLLAGMAGDQQASLFGLACMDPGQTKCSFGTSAMVTANNGGEIGIGAAGTYPIVGWRSGNDTTFTVEGTVVTAGAAIQWLRDGLGIVETVAETETLAASVPDTGGVWVVPALQGLGTPSMRDDVRALVGGISRGTTKAHIVRATLEGIAHRVTDVADAVWANGTRPPALRVDGGASRNDVLMQMQADFLGMPVERAANADGASDGAAKLAGLGAGVWKDTSELGGLWTPADIFEPKISDDARKELRARWEKNVETAVAAV